ncbi:MAG: pyridoxal phosphate-dependent decarboxylase family protein, partial [Rhodospirillaceae bacterium]
MPADEFRRHGHAIVEWIARFMENAERYPVLARVAPGDVRNALPEAAPEAGGEFEAIMADFDRILMPGMTHWNHPGFMAYFSITASAPGVLADFIASALNQQAMLWRTSPSATELEAVVMGWLRRLIGLPDTFEGVIYDTASISSLHAIAAAREAAVPQVRTLGLPGRADVPRLRVYCSDQAHSSIEKGVILAGLGQEGLRKIPSDAEYRMLPDALRAAIAEDRAAGVRPIAVVATVGTTSTTSVDPVAAIAGICETERLWLHIDSAYAGVAAMLPEHADILGGANRADSLVVNPHKWLFTPFDLSAFFCRRMDVVRQAFSLVPDYLKTPDAARNLMDTGIQLGRRFRSLKLWMILRYFGAEGVRERLRYHIELAQQFSAWVDAHADFERLAPVPFSVVCFRARPAGREWDEADLARLNESILARVNDSGEIFISHTVLRGRFTLRVAIGNLQTTERHVRRAWELVQEALA